MQVGMLWFDGDNQLDLYTRIERAATYYKDKYGRTPNLCVVHPATFNKETVERAVNLEIRSSITVQPNYFWLGIKERKLRAIDKPRATV